MPEIKPKSQFLIKRKPSLTQKEFSDHWFEKHAPIVAPYFLSFGFEYYAQTHGPLTSANPELQAEFEKGEWDGAAESVKPHPSPTWEPAWKKAYYDEVIGVDELRFLASRAGTHYKLAEAGSVLGEKRVVIQDGKAIIDIPEDVMKVWREYEARGKEEDDEGK